MQTKNPIFDDMARLATGAAGVVNGMRQELDGVMRSFFERKLDDMNLVSREEFEAVKEMAAKARDENEKLRADLDALIKNKDKTPS